MKMTDVFNYNNDIFGNEYMRIRPIQWSNLYFKSVNSIFRSTGAGHVKFGSTFMDGNPIWIITQQWIRTGKLKITKPKALDNPR